MIGSLVARIVVLAVLWVSVTEAAPSALWYGPITVALVVTATYVLTGRPRHPGASLRVGVLRAVGVVRLAGWIMWRSLVGGIDVARRAMRLPYPDVAPEWLVYDTGLTSTAGRAAFTLVANLMPGSLTAQINGRSVHVHVISPELNVMSSLAALERRISRIESPEGD